MERVAPLRGPCFRGVPRKRAVVPGLVAAATLSLACLTSQDARADEPVPPEPDTNPSVYPRPSARPNLILIGAAVTAGWYGASFGLSHLWPDSDGAVPLRTPVIGPYQALAKTGCASREIDCGAFTLVIRTLLTGFAAVGQTGGVLAMIEGVFVPTGIGLPAPQRQPPRAAGLTVTPAPIPAGDEGVGVGVVGTF